MKNLFKSLFKKNVQFAKKHKLIDVVEEYIDRYIKENQLCEDTARHYEVRRRNLHAFLISQKIPEIIIEDVDIRIMENFRAWLFSNLTTCCRRYASRNLDLCKNALTYAVKMGYTNNNPLIAIKGQRDKPKPIIHLTLNELKKLSVYKFGNDYYNIAAKIFAFQCFTSLSYCELYNFKLVELNGRTWIDSSRKKTGKEGYIYMFDEAKEILDYFGGKIPMISNQSYNRMLKEIAMVLNIQKNISSHVGRKTHATLLDELGVSDVTISRQLRNTTRVCNEFYISKSHTRTLNEFEKMGITTSLLNS